MISNMRYLVPAILILALVAAVACSSQDTGFRGLVEADSSEAAPTGAPGRAGGDGEFLREVVVEKVVTVEVEREAIREVVVEVEKRASAATARPSHGCPSARCRG